MNPFRRVPADPSKRSYKPFLRLSDESVSRIYSQQTSDPDVAGIYGFGSVVRLNSTYLELTDSFYEWRGTYTLAAGFFFCFFFGIFCYFNIMFALADRGDFGIWFGVIFISALMLPLSLVAYRLMISEVFFSTYYPIRFNRKNGMVYVYQSDGEVLSVPWRDIRFVLYSTKVSFSTHWTIVGCITGDDGDSVTETIPLPIDLSWGPEAMLIFWEFIRCYMEEGDEYLPDLADTIPWCPPLDNQKEGWLFGLLYLCRQFARIGLLVNAPLFPFLFMVSFSRWLVMKTSHIPVWPAEVAAACQPDDNDPVNKGAEHNPPQVWRPMLAWQGKVRFAQSYARERGAMDRIIARLKAKHGGPGNA